MRHRSTFVTTQWTLIRQAAASAANGEQDASNVNVDEMQAALTELIKRYWPPLYAYARRRGLSEADAEDATQEFMARLLHGNLLREADPAKGSFRSFLSTAWQRFLIDQYRRQKSSRSISPETAPYLNTAASEAFWQALPAREAPAEQIFNAAWAETILQQARQSLRTEYRQRGREPVLDLLFPYITQRLDSAETQRLSEQLGMSQTACKVNLHRLKQRFAEALRRAVAETVSDPGEIDQELTELRQALMRGT